MQNPAPRPSRRSAFMTLMAPGVLLGSLCCQQDSGKLSSMLLDRLGIQRGICVLLGSDGDLAVQLARSSGLLVHVRDPRRAAVARLRELADTAGFGIQRLLVEEGPIHKLPHADNLVDAILVTAASKDQLDQLSLAEMLRCLRPEARAIVGTTQGTDDDLGGLKEWASTGKAEQITAWRDPTGAWVQFQKAALEGVDAWTHWEHGPDNNPVSTDRVIRAPYMTQFLARPYYIGMPSITTAAGGRTFLAIGHIAHHRREWSTLQRLIARSGYNGTVLWQRKLPESYLVHRSAFIASNETFYMIDGDHALLLDPKTGKEKGEIRMPGIKGEWKWMAMQEGVLYALAGKKEPGTKVTLGDRTLGGWSWGDLSPGYYDKPRIPFGFGDTLAAYSLGKKRLLWKHKERRPIDSRGMALGRDRIYYYCPDLHLRALDSQSGEELWTNDDQRVLGLIERPGRGLTSTPGFRTACMTLATPEALIIQGQTRMNVVAVSTMDGRLLWAKKKISNNPNAIYVDGAVVLGVGRGASHVVLEPVSGETRENLSFRKAACTRLTASPDSFFCRGEGTLRFDRASRKVLIDGAVRPACNDGVIPANGMLYIGPWQCDCNLSLIGHMAKCSAGDFRFDRVATEAERLQVAPDATGKIAPFSLIPEDWPTYRGNNRRSSGTKVRVLRPVIRLWTHRPERPYLPTAPTAAGGLVFIGGEDGKVLALDNKTGLARWQYQTAGPIKSPPTIWEGRAYVGSGDGHVYALEAATGRLLWRFRAAPTERLIMVYESLCSTWPVNSGVLVKDGVAYFAAGIIDQDGTYVFALDARTGKIKWQNNSSGHLSAELRKGVSAQGNLTVQGNLLLLAGGNQVSPARYELETGRCLEAGFRRGQPKANHGRFVGVFRKETVIAGGRILYSSAQNVSSKGSFQALVGKSRHRLSQGGIPPAWDRKTVALVNFKYGKLTCCDADKAAAAIRRGIPRPQGDARPDGRWRSLAEAFAGTGAVRWQSDLSTSNTLEVVSLAVCPNAIVAVVRYQQRARARPQWILVGLGIKTFVMQFRQELPEEPLPGGILIDRSGQVL